MWKTCCRKIPKFLALSDFEQQNPHIIHILIVECVENFHCVEKLYYSVFTYFRQLSCIFTAFLETCPSALFFRFFTFVFFTNRLRSASFDEVKTYCTTAYFAKAFKYYRFFCFEVDFVDLLVTFAPF